MRDDVAVDVSSLDSSDIRIVAPDGTESTCRFLHAWAFTEGSPTAYWAAYDFAPAGGSWGTEDNGIYTVKLMGNQIRDMAGNLSGEQILGTVWIRVKIGDVAQGR